MQNTAKIDPFGFREYDARWLYPENVNLEGIEILGKGLGTQIINHTKKIIQELQLDTTTDLIVKKLNQL